MIKYKNIIFKPSMNISHFFEKMSFLDRECLNLSNIDQLQINHVTWNDLFTINIRNEENLKLTEIGCIKLYKDLNNNNKCRIDVFYISPEFRNSISVKNIFLMLLKYIFEVYNTHKVEFNTLGFNPYTLSIWTHPNLEKIVIQEGCKKASIAFRGVQYNEYFFAIFRDVYLDLATEQYKDIIDEITIE